MGLSVGRITASTLHADPLMTIDRYKGNTTPSGWSGRTQATHRRSRAAEFVETADIEVEEQLSGFSNICGSK